MKMAKETWIQGIYFPFGFEGRIWDLIVSVPDHCLSFYFGYRVNARNWKHASERTTARKHTS